MCPLKRPTESLSVNLEGRQPKSLGALKSTAAASSGQV